jgi:PadR family transcriptional regulator, regulatory protein PadR
MPGRGMRGWGSLLEPALLAALATERAHGYDLRKVVEDITAGGVCADPGGTYRVLRRLEEQGFVDSRWSAGEHGPQRRDYELTEDGRALLAHWREHLMERERALGRLLGVIAEALDGTGNDSAA